MLRDSRCAGVRRRRNAFYCKPATSFAARLIQNAPARPEKSPRERLLFWPRRGDIRLTGGCFPVGILAVADLRPRVISPASFQRVHVEGLVGNRLQILIRLPRPAENPGAVDINRSVRGDRRIPGPTEDVSTPVE